MEGTGSTRLVYIPSAIAWFRIFCFCKTRSVLWSQLSLPLQSGGLSRARHQAPHTGECSKAHEPLNSDVILAIVLLLSLLPSL